LRARMSRQQKELGLGETRAMEVFTVTAWGTVPGLDQIEEDFPGLEFGPRNRDEFGRKLERFGLK